MKIRPSISFLIVVAFIVVVAVLWLGRRSPPISAIAEETNATPAIATPTNRQSTMQVIGNEPTRPAIDNTTNPKTSPMDKAHQEIGLLSDYNDQPIVFYGRIVDQFSNAVADAAVKFEVRIINGYESAVQSGQLTSDANGRFTISGYKGQDLGIGVEKAGYTWVEMRGSGIYSKLWPENQRAHPDFNNPTVIEMWKLQGAEPLAGVNQQFRLSFTDQPIYFNLIAKGVVQTGGDLEIDVTRSPGLIAQRQQDHRDWSIRLIPIAGGIIEPEYNTPAVTFEAPADGYRDSYQVVMNHDDPLWRDNIHKAFFLKSRNGQIYSKFSFDFRINEDPNGTMWLQFKGVANTNGSRNWEATVPSQ